MPIIKKTTYKYEPEQNRLLSSDTQRTWDYIKEEANRVKNKGFYGEDLDEVNNELLAAVDEMKEEVKVNIDEWTNEDDLARSMGIKGST